MRAHVAAVLPSRRDLVRLSLRANPQCLVTQYQNFNANNQREHLFTRGSSQSCVPVARGKRVLGFQPSFAVPQDYGFRETNRSRAKPDVKFHGSRCSSLVGDHHLQRVARNCPRFCSPHTTRRSLASVSATRTSRSFSSLSTNDQIDQRGALLQQNQDEDRGSSASTKPRYDTPSRLVTQLNSADALSRFTSVADGLGQGVGDVVLGVKQSTKQRPPDELYIYEHGDGEEEVVLLHGLAETHQYWLDLLPHLNTSNYKYIIPDLLGHGRSPKPRNEGYNIESHLKYIYRDIFQGWSWESGAPQKRVKYGATIIGHGLGGILAIEFAARHPDKVVRIITIGLPYFENQEDAWLAYSLHRPLDHVVLYNWYTCALSVRISRLLFPVLAHALHAMNNKPVPLIRDAMRYGSARAIYYTFLYCIVYHRLDGAARTIPLLSHVPLHLIHIEGSDSCAPLRCSERFYQKYWECDLAVFPERNDLVLFHSEKLAEYITKIITSK